MTDKDLAAQLADLQRGQRELAASIAAIGGRLDELATEAQFEKVLRRANTLHAIASSLRDDIPALAARLAAARSAPDYELPFTEPNPLVTVRIASYRRTKELMDVALASVLTQTHQNLEIIIVNDGPNPATAKAVRGLNDQRIHYSEFPHRSVYPENAEHRWFVAGSPGMNEGIRRATGHWVAPLDEDDEFTADHIERLLALARESRAELAYGALIQREVGKKVTERIFSYPPRRGGFSFQGAIVHGSLRFFEYDQESWRVSEPGDWNLVRRMLGAGVRMVARDEIVGTLHRIPYTRRDD